MGNNSLADWRRVYYAGGCPSYLETPSSPSSLLPEMVAHLSNLSAWEIETRGLRNSQLHMCSARPVWAMGDHEFQKQKNRAKYSQKQQSRVVGAVLGADNEPWACAFTSSSPWS